MHSRLLKYLTHDPDRGQTVRHNESKANLNFYF